MGTNYYYYYNVCECCGRSDILHIGKSSCGWVFSLHILPELDINDLDDWINLFNTENSYIKDENDILISSTDMLDIITNREERYPPPIRGDVLMRHTIDSYCVGHGKGTWDKLIGEFF